MNEKPCEKQFRSTKEFIAFIMVHTPVFVLRSLLLGLSPAAVLALPQNTASQSDSQDTLLVTTTVSNTPYTITFGPSTVTQATEVVGVLNYSNMKT